MVESLYYEQGEGEIFVVQESSESSQLIMVTCIDISSLYRGKRGKALLLIEELFKYKHPNLVEIYKYWVIPDELIFVEMECPKVLAQWKTLTKKKMTTDEVLETLEQVISGLNFLH